MTHGKNMTTYINSINSNQTLFEATSFCFHINAHLTIRPRYVASRAISLEYVGLYVCISWQNISKDCGHILIN